MELECLNQQQFDRFRNFIYKKCGIRINERKVSLLTNRIRRRLKAGDFEDFDVYYRFLTSPAGVSELGCFLDTITTNETSFFRTAKHFDWLKTDLLSDLVSQQRVGNRSPSLRIWSAACSSGEEPYSIAICLAENQLRLRGWQLEIVATDLSEDVLQSARQGIYKERALQNLDEKRRRRHFTKLKGEPLWQIKPNVRELVSFQRHNLLEPLPGPAFDCIFVRNVLIYFDHQSKQKVIENLIRALAEGGYLVVGPSEGVYDMLHDLTKHSTFLYQK